MQVFKKSFIEDEQIRTAIKKRCLPRSSDVQDMNKARAEFKALCNDIKAFSGAEEFTGSFEEINHFLEDYQAETDSVKIKKLEFLVAWLIKNSILVHESEKVGLFSPELFTQMQAEEPVEDTPVVEEQTVEEVQ